MAYEATLIALDNWYEQNKTKLTVAVAHPTDFLTRQTRLPLAPA